MTFAAMVYVASTADVSTHMYWYLGRSSGLVAYWLLFASVALGLAVSSRVFDGMLGRGWVFEIHKFLSLFVLVVMCLHALIMLPDPYAKFTLRELLVPMQSHYRNGAMAVGIVTFYGSVFVSATFYMKGIIGQRGWRAIHYTTFALFVGAMAHGLLAGTDAALEPVRMSYLASGVAVLFLTFFRILAARSAPKPRAKQPPARTSRGDAPAATDVASAA